MQTATREDIDACFRLLLGREPHPEEVAGHYSLAGAPLTDVVRSYLQSLEFQHRGLLTAKTKAALVSVEGFNIYVDPEDRVIGAHVRPGYEPELTRVFLEHLNPDSSVLDIGANCGYFSMLACSRGATVYAFEPLPSNVRLLMASRARNRFAGLLYVIAAAASDQPGTLSIAASYSDGIVAPAPEHATLALSLDYAAAVRADHTVPSYVPVGLIKIDVEGHEHSALEGASGIIERWQPVILTEFAPSALEANSHVSGRDYLERIRSWGYRLQVADDPVATGIEAILSRAEGVDHIDVLALPH